MTHRLVRAAIAERLRTIINIGQVHEYERWVKNESGLRSLYAVDVGDKQIIKGWFIHRETKKPSYSGLCYAHQELWQIRGFMSLDDATESEKLFDDLTDAVLSAFNSNTQLLNNVELVSIDTNLPLQLVQAQPVMFSGVLCHSATLALTTVVSSSSL